MQSSTRHRKPKQSYAMYVRKVLNSVDADAAIDGAALKVATSMVGNHIDKLAQDAKVLLTKNHQKQVNDTHIKAAYQLAAHFYRDELRREILVDNAEKRLEEALRKHAAAKGGSQSERAGVILPVGRIQSMLRKQRVGTRVSPSAAVAVACLAEESLRLVLTAANVQRKLAKVARITPHHIRLALDKLEMFPGTVAHGGVVPHIEEALLPKVSGKRKAAADAEEPAAKKTKA